MRISDWSSDVCSSDLRAVAHDARHGLANSPLENRAPRHKTELMCPLDHGVTLVADHDGAAVDTLDQFAALRHDIPQSRFLLDLRSEEHTSELQSLMRISYAVFCLKKKNTNNEQHKHTTSAQQRH